MEITVLGCGTNIPNPKKSGPCFYIKDGKDSVLLDMGPNSLRNMVIAGIDRFEIKNIIFTHFHLDHFADFFPFLANRNFTELVKIKKLEKGNIFGPVGAKEYLADFKNTKEAMKKFTIKNLKNSHLKIGKLNISTLLLSHGDKKIIGVRIEKDSKILVYTGDTGVCKNLHKLLENADVAISECAFSQKMSWEGHLNSRDVGIVAQKANVKTLVLTHIYPFVPDKQIKKEVQKYFKGEVILARDLLRIKV